MIVDCHTHINCPSKRFDQDQFKENLEKLDAAIILAMPEDSNELANKQVISFAAENPKAIGFAVIDPLKDSISTSDIEKLREQGMKGIVVYCPESRMHPCHSKAFQLYEAASELKMPVFFHGSSPYSPGAILDYAQPYLLDEVAREFPELKILIGNIAGPFMDQALAVLAKNCNVFGCLTIDPEKKWQLYNVVATVAEADVMDKLVYGSGYPCGSVQDSVEALLGFNRLFADMQLPTVPREKIKGIVERNVLELLEIDL